jgi:hypothetical protein
MRNISGSIAAKKTVRTKKGDVLVRVSTVHAAIIGKKA